MGKKSKLYRAQAEKIDRGAMLALADELIAHDLPEPVVAPEPVDIPMPEPLLPEEPEAEA